MFEKHLACTKQGEVEEVREVNTGFVGLQGTCAGFGFDPEQGGRV